MNIIFSLNQAQNLENLIDKLRTIHNVALVIDNCNDDTELTAIKPILLRLGWKIVVTSRTKPESFINETIAVGELNPKDGLELFLRFYNIQDNEEISLIEKNH